MDYPNNKLKNQELFFSLIYIPLIVLIGLIGGENEIAFAIVAGISELFLLGLLIRLSFKLRIFESRIKFKSFGKFLGYSIIFLIIIIIINVLLMQNCKGGLCGLSEAETILIFVSVQIFNLLVYGVFLA